MTIYSGFSHKRWWFSIVMLVYQRVTGRQPWFALKKIASSTDFPKLDESPMNLTHVCPESPLATASTRPGCSTLQGIRLRNVSCVSSDGTEVRKLTKLTEKNKATGIKIWDIHWDFSNKHGVIYIYIYTHMHTHTHTHIFIIIYTHMTYDIKKIMYYHLMSSLPWRAQKGNPRMFDIFLLENHRSPARVDPISVEFPPKTMPDSNLKNAAGVT